MHSWKFQSILICLTQEHCSPDTSMWNSIKSPNFSILLSSCSVRLMIRKYSLFRDLKFIMFEWSLNKESNSLSVRRRLKQWRFLDYGKKCCGLKDFKTEKMVYFSKIWMYRVSRYCHSKLLVGNKGSVFKESNSGVKLIKTSLFLNKFLFYCQVKPLSAKKIPKYPVVLH